MVNYWTHCPTLCKNDGRYEWGTKTTWPSWLYNPDFLEWLVKKRDIPNGRTVCVNAHLWQTSLVSAAEFLFSFRKVRFCFCPTSPLRVVSNAFRTFSKPGASSLCTASIKSVLEVDREVKSVEERSQKRKQKNFEALLAPSPPHPTPYPHPLPLPPSPCTVDGLRMCVFSPLGRHRNEGY